MGKIYLGLLKGAEGFERALALKMLKDATTSDPSFVRMFIDEARILARLSHPGIVQIYELGKEDNVLFLVMELLFGQSLADVWHECHERGYILRGDVVAWIGARVAEALQYAHEARAVDGTLQNLVHRDVNPSNIIVTYDGHIKLIDFGLVKGEGRLSKTEHGVVKGKIAYLSPEQTSGKEPDRRSDIFSLGTTLWEVSADARLFKRESDLETFSAIREAEVPDPTRLVPEYPSLLWLVLRRALARDVDQRYATMAELARDLDGVARAHGSILQASTIAEIMSALFAEEQKKEAAWFKEAMAPQPKENLSMLRPPGPRQRAASDLAAMPDLPYLVPAPLPPAVPRRPQETTMMLSGGEEPRRFAPRPMAIAAAVGLALALVIVAIVELLR